MLAIHWAPVGNTKHILKNGIRKTKRGLYCFPLTGHKVLDKWWVNFFNNHTNRGRKKFNGIVFRITQADMPAKFGHWIGSTSKDNFEKEINDLETLERQYRDTVLCRMGEMLHHSVSNNFFTDGKHFIALAQNELKTSPGALNKLLATVDFMTFAFEDYQIVLSSSIKADRIIKVLPQGDKNGRALRKEKLYKHVADKL